MSASQLFDADGNFKYGPGAADVPTSVVVERTVASYAANDNAGAAAGPQLQAGLGVAAATGANLAIFPCSVTAFPNVTLPEITLPLEALPYPDPGVAIVSSVPTRGDDGECTAFPNALEPIHVYTDQLVVTGRLHKGLTMDVSGLNIHGDGNLIVGGATTGESFTTRGNAGFVLPTANVGFEEACVFDGPVRMRAGGFPLTGAINIAAGTGSVTVHWTAASITCILVSWQGGSLASGVLAGSAIALGVGTSTLTITSTNLADAGVAYWAVFV